jgi:hypothetical protein
MKNFCGIDVKKAAAVYTAAAAERKIDIFI